MGPNTLLLPLLFALAQEEAPAQAEALAIQHVSVVPMDSEVVLEDVSVLIRDGRIVAMGPAAEIELPAGVPTLDGRGRFLMPGLADMHVHVWDENDLYLFVANGVTTVRNLFGSPQHLEWRERIAGGDLVGPQIYTAGPIIDGEPAVWPGSVELTDPDEAAAVVAEQKEAGYDFLKPYSRLTRECYEALAGAADEQGMPLMGHVPESMGLFEVLEANQAVIEHLGGWAKAAQRKDSPLKSVHFQNEFLAWKEVDDGLLDICAEAMFTTGVWNCPTLIVLQKWARGDEARARLARPEMRFVSPFVRASWAPESPMNYLSRMPDEGVRSAHEVLPYQQRAVAALRDASAGILLGTDMGNPYVVAGFAVHEELALLVAAGLTPFEALRAGTAEAARCMEGQNEWGTLRVGARADLLLLEANPLEDVAHANRRVGVVLAGRWLPEEELQEELERRAAGFAPR